MFLTLRDDRGVSVTLARPPQRIVSLVPSDTYTLMRLGAGARLVGRTQYCVEPSAEVAGVAEVGGTKNPDVAKIIALQPELVLMNQEENSRGDAEKLRDAGLQVFVTFPRRLADGLAQVGRLARVLGDLGAPGKELVRWAYEVEAKARAEKPTSPAVATFVPIWADPWMTIHGDTFISDVLAHVGASNVFADRRRRYPLGADLYGGPELPAEKTEGKDTRYPRITLDEVVERKPELVLLPDEPHPFSETDAATLRALPIPAAEHGRVLFCSGRHLMWPGVMSLEGLEHLRAMVAGSS